MLGAIIGDTVGSVYEFNNTKSLDFPLFSEGSIYTDDSIISLAVAKWLIVDKEHTHRELERIMVEFAERYPNPCGSYGGGFLNWLFYPEKIDKGENSEISTVRYPYKSWGNGSAMRVSAVGWVFDTLEETERVAEISASITHNHTEGIKGAQATAAAIYLARMGSSKEDIKNYIESKYGYDLSRNWDDLHLTYRWDSSCQGTVPEAIIAFLSSSNFEDAIRRAVALGGDSDTLACITGAIAEAFYQEIPKEMVLETINRLPKYLRDTLEDFQKMIG